MDGSFYSYNISIYCYSRSYKKFKLETISIEITTDASINLVLQCSDCGNKLIAYWNSRYQMLDVDICPVCTDKLHSKISDLESDIENLLSEIEELKP